MGCLGGEVGKIRGLREAGRREEGKIKKQEEGKVNRPKSRRMYACIKI